MDWKELSETSVDIPPKWIHRCVMAAYLIGIEDLLPLTLKEEHPYSFAEGV